MDEDDLKWVKTEKKNVIVKQFHDSFRSKIRMFQKLSHSYKMQNDALRHREGFKG